MTLYGAPFADPLRPWETDAEQLLEARRYSVAEIGVLARAIGRIPEDVEEPWAPADPAAPAGLDLLDGATRLTAWWVYLTAAIAAALVAVLVVIGIRRFSGPAINSHPLPCVAGGGISHRVSHGTKGSIR